MSAHNKKPLQCILLPLIFCLTAAACTKQAGEGRKADTEAEVNIEAENKTQDQEAPEIPAMTEIKERADSMPSVPLDTDREAGTGEKQENEGIMTVYTTEDPKKSDEEIPVLYTDDLSLLAGMGPADSSYAYRDGNVYYRQYHEDSYEEGALWADYQPTAGADKEIVCIDAAGEKTVLFQDKGYGSIYLAGEHFFMTEMITVEEGNISYDTPVIYSVDMQGQNRKDYGRGKISAFDMDRNVLILNMQSDESWEGTYAALDCTNGEMTPLVFGDCDFMTFWDYHDGWCYFDAHRREEENRVCRVAAVSLAGEQKEIIALTDGEAEEMGGYVERICQMEVDGERLYIVFGGYAGSGSFYQGGRIITTKLDGSDYRALEAFNDIYYVCNNGGRTLVYLPHTYRTQEDEEYSATVWDMEADTLFPSDFPYQFIHQQQSWPLLPYQRQAEARPLCILTGEETNVYALPGDCGIILPVAMNIDEKIMPYDGGEADLVNYDHLYYADGFLYFEVVYNIYDRDYAIGWRDGYRRLQTDVYRLKPDGTAAELLYSY